MQRKSVPWRGTIPKKEYTSNFVDPEQRLLVIHEEPKTWDNSKMKILIQQEKRKMVLYSVNLVFNASFFYFPR